MVNEEIKKVIIINTFSWDTVLTIFSILGTFVASVIALYLGTNFKRVVVVSTGYKINSHTFNEHDDGKKYQEISIYNASERKIRLQDYGYMVGNKKYTTKHNRIVHNIVRPIKEQIKSSTGNIIGTHLVVDESVTYFPFYLLDGEDCQFGLFPGDYPFNKAKSNKKLYVYVKINEKIYKYYTGLNLRKYFLLTENIQDKSPFNHG